MRSLAFVIDWLCCCRFVRFVTTPELLERFVTIEKEIVQIENSIQSNELTSSAIEAEGIYNLKI